MNVPDVTVVVPVFNTMPHLTRCLTSLTGQTIGLDRMRIITVDDGSTDGSGRELDRFARRFPGVLTVIHQANSGGPAGPCNRALDLATGRYVFFVGSDDYLGVDALRRLVGAADEYGSDVVLGKVVGVNSRFIYQDIFARNAADVDLYDSPLPRSLANTKLFRRELIERHHIRYPEGLPLGSDMPFTLEACVRATRISVLSDYEFYYAVRRLSATNITYVSRHLDRLRALRTMMAFTADLLDPGPRRDVVLAHRFDHEVRRLLEDDFLRLDVATQQEVHDGVGRLVRDYLTDGIVEKLGAETRIRLRLAGEGQLEDLVAVISQDAHHGVPATIVDGDRRYAGYPGLRDPARQLPDRCFDVTTAPDWPAKLDATAVTWETVDGGDRVLSISARTPVDLLAIGSSPLTVSAEEIPADVCVTAEADGGTIVRARFKVVDLVAGSGATGRRRTVTAWVGEFDPDRAVLAAGATGAGGAAPIRTPGLRGARPYVHRHGLRLRAIMPSRDPSGRLMISVVPLTPRRVLARLRQFVTGRISRKRTSRK